MNDSLPVSLIACLALILFFVFSLPRHSKTQNIPLPPSLPTSRKTSFVPLIQTQTYNVPVLTPFDLPRNSLEIENQKVDYFGTGTKPFEIPLPKRPLSVRLMTPGFKPDKSTGTIEEDEEVTDWNPKVGLCKGKNLNGVNLIKSPFEMVHFKESERGLDIS